MTKYTVDKFRPRLHSYVFKQKRILLYAFAPSIYMETCENAMKTETNENGFQSGDFGKRIHLKTVAFPCKRLKTNTSSKNCTEV